MSFVACSLVFRVFSRPGTGVSHVAPGRILCAQRSPWLGSGCPKSLVRVPAGSWPATPDYNGELLPPGWEGYSPSWGGVAGSWGGGWKLGCPAGDPEGRPLNCGGGPDGGPQPPQPDGLPPRLLPDGGWGGSLARGDGPT